jgi:phenylalanyl-tRNA synthetase beta chain
MLLAHFGEIHPETLRGLDVAGPIAAFEVFMDALPPEKKKGAARPLLDSADLMPVHRDFAFLLDASVPAGDVVKAAASVDRTLITHVNVFDLFEGESLGAGRKSLALEVTLQPREKTLTDQEIEAISAKIVAEVKRATGGDIRG